MKRTNAARPAPREVPALLAKFGKCSTPLRALEYDAKKKDAEFVLSNLAGRTPKDWGAEMAAFAAGAPRCTRHVDHVSLSLDPRLGRLSLEQWQKAAEVWLREMRYEDRPVVVQRHSDSGTDHIHLTICRVDANGRVHKDSNNYSRSHAAAAKAGVELGPHSLPPRPPSEKESATDAAHKAQRRSARRALGEPRLKVLDAGAIAAVMRRSIDSSATTTELVEACRRAGVELEVVKKSGGEVHGLRARPLAGDGTWLKASELSRSRDLSWSRVAKRLQENELRWRAIEAAGERAAEARERAVERVAQRVERYDNSTNSLPGATRALTPEQIQKEKLMINDPLNFMSVSLSADDRTATEPPPQSDDAALVVTDEEARRKLEAQEAYKEICEQLRAMDEKSLLDLEGIGRGTKAVVLTPTVLWHLLRLVLKVLSLGVIDIGASPKEREVIAKRKLGEMASEELGRRKAALEGEPFAVRQRAIDASAKVVEERKNLLEARTTIAPTGLDPHALAEEAEAAERRHDEDARRAGHPSLAHLRVACGAAEAAVKTLRANRPTGLLARVSGKRAAHQAELAEAQQQARRARRRLAFAQERMEMGRQSRIQALEMEIKAERAAIQRELKRLQERLKELDGERRKLAQAVERRRISDAVRDDDSSAEGTNPNDRHRGS